MRLLTIASEVLVPEFDLRLRSESHFRSQIMPSRISVPDRLLRAFRKRLRKEIFTNETWNVTVVAGYVLETDLVSGTSYPVLGVPA